MLCKNKKYKTKEEIKTKCTPSSACVLSKIRPLAALGIFWNKNTRNVAQHHIVSLTTFSSKYFLNFYIVYFEFRRIT